MSRLRDLLPTLPRLDDGGPDIDHVGPINDEDLREFVEELRDVDRDEYREPAYRERMAIAKQLEQMIDDDKGEH